MKKWTIEEICEAIDDTKAKREGYRRRAEKWQCMFDLVLWSEAQRNEAVLQHRRLVTSSQPRATALLVQRLMADRPKILVPSNLFSEKEDQDAQGRAQFLELLLESQRSNNEFGVDLISALKWQAPVRGRAAVQVAWVKPLLPQSMRKYDCPILIRPLDPLNVGVERDSFGTLYAFHQYEETLRGLITRYPKSKELADLGDDMKQIVYVTDFWWQDREDGSVGHAVLGSKRDGKVNWFLQKPTQMSYHRVPILECYADPVPVRDESRKGNSIYAGWEELWENESTLDSMLLTGVQDYLFPARVAQNEMGQPVPDIEAGGGKITQVPAGTRIQDLLTSPNVPVLDAMSSRLQRNIAQMTFPQVLYGDGGNLQAGYAVSMLSNSARGRMQGIIYPLERMLEEAFEISLCLVQEYAGPEGVTLYGYSKVSKAMYGSTLTPDKINGFYLNHVQLSPNIPGNELQELAMYLQLASNHIISRRAVRENLPIDLPQDEDERVILEIAQQDPDTIKQMARKMSEVYYQQPLPPGEPDGKMTEEMMQQMQQRMMQQQQQPPPGPPLLRQAQESGGRGQMPPPGMIQPGQVLPGSNLPPAMQGQLTPQALGLPPNLQPDVFAQVVGQGVTR